MSTARSSMSFSASVLWRVKIPQGEMDMSTWWTAVIGRDGPVDAAREVRDSILKPVVGNLHHVSCTPTHPRVSTAHAHTQTRCSPDPCRMSATSELSTSPQSYDGV